MNLKHLSILLAIALFPALSFAQVKIGDPTGPPDPKAVLELKDTTRGFLLPRMTQAHMEAIVAPPDGLLIYNNTEKSIYQYRTTDNLWMPLRSDSAEWIMDTISKKLYLRRGLAATDSVYYNTNSKKFIFADTRFYRGTTGIPFNLDEGNSDKHVFKTTASMFPRQVSNLNSANIYAIYEVDNDTAAINHPDTASYTALAVATTVAPTATQKMSDITGISIATGSAAQDSLFGQIGISNNVYTRGNGYTDVMYGQFNSVSSGGSNSANVGLMYGNYLSMSYTPAASTHRILYGLYGHFINISSTMNNRVDGPAYGLFMTNVRASSALGNPNYALFTNKGINRFGDSTLITDVGFGKPRAVLDVNATSAMILPTGNTAQRPAITYPGMLRYNSDATVATAEVNTGSSWKTLAAVISTTAILDPASIASGATGSIFYTLSGAAFGNTVTISPDVALPSGFFITWARVSAINQIEVGFGNISGAAIDLTAQNFYIKLVQ